MPAKYKVVPKRNPRNPTAPPKYHPLLKYTDKVGIRYLVNQIAMLSTLSPIDMMAGIEALLTVIPQALIEGKIVELGEFGSFRLRLRSSGEDNPEDVTAIVILNEMYKATFACHSRLCGNL